MILAVIAFLIAGTFFFWKEILAAENGRMGRIYSLEKGYFLWIASITFFNNWLIIFIHKI